MITLQISKNKILTSVYTNNYSGENNFETLQVICEKFISGQDISKLETKIYFSFPNQTKDILLVDFEEVNGQLLALYKIEQKYTQFIGNIKVFAKFIGSNIIGSIVQARSMHGKICDINNTLKLINCINIKRIDNLFSGSSAEPYWTIQEGGE